MSSFEISLRSLSGNQKIVEVCEDTPLDYLRESVEDALPDFYQIKLIVGKDEILGSSIAAAGLIPGSVVQGVAVADLSAAVAAVDAYMRCSNQKSRSSRSKAISAMNLISAMADLPSKEWETLRGTFFWFLEQSENVLFHMRFGMCDDSELDCNDIFGSFYLLGELFGQICKCPAADASDLIKALGASADELARDVVGDCCNFKFSCSTAILAALSKIHIREPTALQLSSMKDLASKAAKIFLQPERVQWVYNLQSPPQAACWKRALNFIADYGGEKARKSLYRVARVDRQDFHTLYFYSYWGVNPRNLDPREADAKYRKLGKLRLFLGQLDVEETVQNMHKEEDETLAIMARRLGAPKRTTRKRKHKALPVRRRRRPRSVVMDTPEETEAAVEHAFRESEKDADRQEQTHLHEAILKSKQGSTLRSLSVKNEDYFPETKRTRTSAEAPSTTDVGSMCASLLSVVGSEPKCYMQGTSFRAKFGGTISAEDIENDAILIAADGSDVTVKSIRRYSSSDRAMVWLETVDFKIPLTENHRVVVLRRALGVDQRQTIPAGHLRQGDRVLAGNSEQILTQVQHFLGDFDVFEMVFEPDAEIETFYITSETGQALLTKGSKADRIVTRRGGMRKK